MRHGIDGYFQELASFERRLGIALVVVSAASLLLMLAFGQRVVTAVLEDPMRFGFEGPEQWVARIRLEEIANRDVTGEHAVTYVTPESRRGDGPRATSRDAFDRVRTKPRLGEGLDEQDVLARARMLALDAPVVRSEDLVIERLVRPDYPEEARDHNVEGVVEMVALVDTTGDVIEVHIVGGTHDPSLELAATRAVLQCRYRPYRVNAVVSRVWAAYRISFSLY